MIDTLSIRDVLGIRSADIPLPDVGEILEIVGPNASGKTSVALAAAALLTRNANPLGLPAAGSRRAYEREGADGEGQASFGDTTWYVGSGRITSPPDTPPCRPEAVGLVDFTALRRGKEAAALFQPVLLPPVADVMERVRIELEPYLPPEDLSGTMQMLQEQGWDATLAIFTQRNRDAKRAWATIAGRHYGSKIAADWRPDGWLADYDSMTPETAAADVAAAREALQALHRVQAVSEAEAERAAAAADELPGLRDELEAAKHFARSIEAQLADLALPTLRQDVTRVEQAIRLADQTSQGASCPHCGSLVYVEGGQLLPEPSRGIPDHTALAIALQSAQTALHDAQEKAAALNLTMTEAAGRVHVLHARVQDTERLAAKIALPVADQDAATIALAHAEQDVADAQSAERMVSAEDAARRMHETVGRYTVIVDAIGPRGVRARMIADRLGILNRGLLLLSNRAGWPAVTISDQGYIAWGERPVALCSESERWRAQACIQLTVAAMTGSPLVVLDRADLLDAANREGLRQAVARATSKCGVLICSTGEPSTDAPWDQILISGGAV